MQFCWILARLLIRFRRRRGRVLNIGGGGKVQNIWGGGKFRILGGGGGGGGGGGARGTKLFAGCKLIRAPPPISAK